MFPQTWDDPEQCPFCQQQLENGGEAFIRHIDKSDRCKQGFENWRGNVSGDMRGGWIG
jgi:hypothetical protein